MKPRGHNDVKHDVKVGQDPTSIPYFALTWCDKRISHMDLFSSQEGLPACEACKKAKKP